MICDLHTHSCFSDGTNTPTEIISLAVKKGLSAVALTDHNNILGLEEFFAAAEKTNIEAVGGIEISAEFLNKEIHILGLFVTKEHFVALSDYLEDYSMKKIINYKKLYEKLVRAGYDISYKNIAKFSENGVFNRVHFAKELMNKGYVSSIKEAFKGVLSEDKGYYTPVKRLNGFEVIEFLSSIGLTPVLAHPFLNLEYNELLEFLPKAKEKGLKAIETDYSLFNEEQTQNAHKLAEQFGLLKSGGSDYHGENKPHIDLAVGKGNLVIPYEYYLNLKNKSERFAHTP